MNPKDLFKFKCKFCGDGFTKEHSLNRHIETMHEKLKYTCSVCDREFTRLYSLKNHTRKGNCSLKLGNNSVIRITPLDQWYNEMPTPQPEKTVKVSNPGPSPPKKQKPLE